MNLVFDPVFDEVELNGVEAELARVAAVVAVGEGFVGAVSSAPPGSEPLVGVEVRRTPGPGVSVLLDGPRQTLVVSGDAVAMALFADQLRVMTAAMASEEGGTHRHIQHYPGHPYLAEGSVPLMIGIP
ncbi:Imm32 family immunity protein [Actinomadura harenae]|uniref:Uncharacterized protein n=1 Tax=Actinomadura harenae TaxID=2483351 RepID=A0A3M2LYJ4_9ACTN|nr:hypothetical protein [Actinomadura harenae]RMI42604.1 hypothetical protein EBO15_19225 [Actinomadura harenae]